MKPYPKYKDSGIEWIGKVPKGWEKSKIKFCTEFINGYAFKSDDYVTTEGIPLIRIGDIKPEIDFNEAQKVPEEYAAIFKTFAVKKNDILVALTGATIGKSSVYKSTRPALLNQRVAILRPKGETHNNFLKFFIDSDIFKKLIEYECVGGAQENIGKKEIGSCVLYLPKLLDQVQTSLFLDHKTTQIDNLISKKQKLIELLKEERATIINQAVTKGLNPDAPMKDSGIEWIGEIPTHWGVKRLKYVAKTVQTGTTPSSLKPEYFIDGEIDWFTPVDFRDSLFLSNSNRKLNRLAIDDNVARLYGSNTVLLVGIGATLGKVSIIKRPASSNQQINAISFKDNYNPDFGAYYFQAISDIIVSMSNVATLPILNQTQTKEIMVLVPPQKEQDEIVGFINQTTTKINKTTSKIEKQIDLLKEFRTALISEVVTGKIDVRDGGSK
jgi:type I restriction enzyme S subunit